MHGVSHNMVSDLWNVQRRGCTSSPDVVSCSTALGQTASRIPHAGSTARSCTASVFSASASGIRALSASFAADATLSATSLIFFGFCSLQGSHLKHVFAGFWEPFIAFFEGSSARSNGDLHLTARAPVLGAVGMPGGRADTEANMNTL